MVQRINFNELTLLGGVSDPALPNDAATKNYVDANADFILQTVQTNLNTPILAAIGATATSFTTSGDTTAIFTPGLRIEIDGGNQILTLGASSVAGGVTTTNFTPALTSGRAAGAATYSITQTIVRSLQAGTGVAFTNDAENLTITATTSGTVSDVNITEPNYRNVDKTRSGSTINFAITDNAQPETALFSGNRVISQLLFNAPGANNPTSDGTGTINFTLATGLTIRGFNTAQGVITVPDQSAFDSVILADAGLFFTDTRLWQSTYDSANHLLTLTWIGTGSPIITPGAGSNDITMVLAGGWSPAGSTGSVIAVLTDENAAPTFKSLTSQQVLPAVFGTPTNNQVIGWDNPNTRLAWQTPSMGASINQASTAATTYTFTAAVASGATTGTVLTDVSAIFPVGSRFQLGPNTGTNQLLTVSAVSFAGGVTTITWTPALVAGAAAGTVLYTVALNNVTSLEAGNNITLNNQAGNLTINAASMQQFADILGAQIAPIEGAVSAGSGLVTLSGDFRTQIPNGSSVGFLMDPNGNVRYTTSGIQFVGNQTTFTITPSVTMAIPNATGIALWTRTPYTDIAPGSNVSMTVSAQNVLTVGSSGGAMGVSQINGAGAGSYTINAGNNTTVSTNTATRTITIGETTPTQINNGGVGSYTIAGGANTTVNTNGQQITISSAGGGGSIAQAAGYNDGVINTAYYNFSEGAQPNTPFDQHNEGTFWQGASGYSTDPRYIQATTSATPSRGWTYFGTQVGSAFSSASYGVQTFTIGISGTATANANPNNIVVGPNFRKPQGWYDNGGSIAASIVVASGVATITYNIDAVTISGTANSGTVGAAGDAIFISGASATDLNGYKQVVTASNLSGRNQTITYATTAVDGTYPAQLQYLVDQFPGYIRNNTTRATLLPQNSATPAFSTLVNGNRFFGGTFGTPFLYNNSVWLVGLTLSFGVTKATTSGQNVDFSNPVSIGGVQFNSLVIDDAVSSTQLTLRIPGTFSSAPTINLPASTFIAVWSPGLYSAGDAFGTLGTTTGGFIRAVLPANTYYQDSEFCVFPNGFRTPAATKGDGTPNTFAVHWDFFVSTSLNVTSLAFSNAATNNNNRHGINGINGGSVGGNVTLIEPNWRTVSYTNPNNAETITVVDNPQPSTYVFSGNTTQTVITFPNGLAAVSDGTATINFTVTAGTSITGFTPNVTRTLGNGVPNSDYLTNPATYSAWWDPTLWSADIVVGGFVYTYIGTGNPIVTTGTITLVFSTTGWLPPEMPGNLTSVITQGANQPPTFKPLTSGQVAQAISGTPTNASFVGYQNGLLTWEGAPASALSAVLAVGRTTDAGGAIRFTDGSGYVGFKAPTSVTTSFDFTLPPAAPSVTTPVCLTSDNTGQIGFSTFQSLLPLDTVGWVNSGINYYSTQATSTVNVNATFTAMLAGLNLAGTLTGFTDGSPVIGVTTNGGSVTGFYNASGPSITGLLVDRASGFVAGTAYSFLWRAGAQARANIQIDTTGSGSPANFNELGYDPNFLTSAVDSTNASRYVLRNAYPFIISDAATPVVQARIRTVSNELEIGAVNASATGSRNLNISAYGASGMVNIGKQGGAWLTQQSSSTFVQLIGQTASGATQTIITGLPLYLGTQSDVRIGDYSLAGLLTNQGIQILPSAGIISPIAPSSGNGSLSLRYVGTGSVTIGTSSQLVVSSSTTMSTGITVPNPIALTDVANLQSVQAAAQGISVQAGVNTSIAEANVAGTYTAGATIAGGSWTGTAPLVINGYTPVVGDLIVFVAQTPSSPGNVGNGGFTVTANPATGSWTATRSHSPRVGNMYLALRGTNEGAQWINNTMGTIGLSTPLTFAQFGIANSAAGALTINQVLQTGKTATAANTDGTIWGSNAVTPLRFNSSTTGATSLQWVGATGTAILSGTGGGLVQIGGTGATNINFAAGSSGSAAVISSTNGPLSIGDGSQNLNLVSSNIVIGTTSTSTLTFGSTSSRVFFTPSQGIIEFRVTASVSIGLTTTSILSFSPTAAGTTINQNVGNVTITAAGNAILQPTGDAILQPTGNAIVQPTGTIALRASTVIGTGATSTLTIANTTTSTSLTQSAGDINWTVPGNSVMTIMATGGSRLTINPQSTGVTLSSARTGVNDGLNLQSSGTGVIRMLSNTTFGPIAGAPNLNVTTPAAGPTLTATSGNLTLVGPLNNPISLGATTGAMLQVIPFAGSVTLAVASTGNANMTLQATGTGGVALGSPLIAGGGAGTANQILASRGGTMSPQWVNLGSLQPTVPTYLYRKNGTQTIFNVGVSTALIFNTTAAVSVGASFGSWNSGGTTFTFSAAGTYQLSYSFGTTNASLTDTFVFTGDNQRVCSFLGVSRATGNGFISATNGGTLSVYAYLPGQGTVDYQDGFTSISITKVS